MQYENTSSSFLVRLSDVEDLDAWAEFFRRYGGLIQGFLTRAGVRPVDRDDIAQEVTLSLFRALPNFEYDREKGRFRAYLKTVVLRTAARHAQRIVEVPSAEPLDASVESHLEALWEREWRRHHVRVALAQVSSDLSQRERIAFDRYVVAGATAASAAAASGLPIDRVYRVRWKAMKRLSELIENQIEGEA